MGKIEQAKAASQIAPKDRPTYLLIWNRALPQVRADSRVDVTPNSTIRQHPISLAKRPVDGVVSGDDASK